MGRLIDRSRASSQISGAFSDTAFDSGGIAAGVSGADIALILAAHPSVVELGHPGIQEAEGTAGNASVTETVPAGKYWRLLALYHTLVTDATVANRAVVVTTQDATDTEIEAITHANVAASTTAKRTTLFGTDDYVVGSRGVAAQGTLTVAADVTEDDTIVINGVTFTFKDALTGAANEILNGADHDATQASLEAAFKDRDNMGVLHSVDDATFDAIAVSMGAFSSDDAVFTADVKGVAGNSIATTETFTSGSNVFDAATLGTTTAGLDQADKISTVDFPASGAILAPGEDLVVSVTNGVAGDSLDTYLVYLEFDANPNP
jgi:hypothetical protein